MNTSAQQRWIPRTHFAQWLARVQPSEEFVLILTAVLVGLGAGLGAIVFRWLLDQVEHLAFGPLFDVFRRLMGPWGVILVPALGGLIVGPMIYFFAREAKGHGVPEVMEAVALRGGRIRPIVAVIKSLASSISIGTGGAVGREGPIAQIGATLGSTLGQILRLSDERIANLVACGAAGGVAATFNAPIAGVIFALEVILGEFSVRYFSTVVLSAVTASVVGRAAFGDAPAFSVPLYTLVHPTELLLYALLGILGGLTGTVFTRVLYALEDLFARLRQIPEYLHPVVGGALVGLIGVGFPQVFGVGYETIEAALLGKLALGTLLLLIVLKIIATSVTIGSGGSGGVFAPSLFIGAMLGGAFGTIVHQLWPGITAEPGAYALVGMAAVFAGAARAPITAILILFEMSGDYHIILPLMTATVIGTLIGHAVMRESIYTMKLVRRGIRLRHGRDVDLMRAIRVEEAMTRDVETVPVDMPLLKLHQLFDRTHHHGFPVVDKDGYLVGIVTLQDLEKAMQHPEAEKLTAGEIATRNPTVTYPDETLHEALRKMGSRGVGRLPVVDRRDRNRFLGLIRRHDIIQAYSDALSRRVELEHRLEQMRLRPITGTRFIELDITPDSPAAGKAMREIPLPEPCIVISLRRGPRLFIPRGDTVLEPGDHITILAKEKYADQACRCFLPESTPPSFPASQATE